MVCRSYHLSVMFTVQLSRGSLTCFGLRVGLRGKAKCHIQSVPRLQPTLVFAVGRGPSETAPCPRVGADKDNGKL
jgi:hypothetical protein